TSTLFFFFTPPPPPPSSTLSLHAALPISLAHLADHHVRPLLALAEAALPLEHHLDARGHACTQLVDDRPVHRCGVALVAALGPRSEEHTSELQSRFDLVCRLLLEKKKQRN